MRPVTILASLACGVIFGAGLLVSGMTQPAKVLSFLDVLGPWDPTLAFVMAAALGVSSAGFALARRAAAPIFAAGHQWPARKGIDSALVVGSLLFGAGWGLVGLCPGPAIENLATRSPGVIVFVLAMVAGTGLQRWWQGRLARAASDPTEMVAATDG